MLYMSIKYLRMSVTVVDMLLDSALPIHLPLSLDIQGADCCCCCCCWMRSAGLGEANSGLGRARSGVVLRGSGARGSVFHRHLLFASCREN